MAERRLASYLLMPRLGEARFKAWLPAASYAIVGLGGAGATGGAGGAPVWAALVATAVFEVGPYQARYMLNDLADTEVDRAHVAASARGRLPGGATARRAAVAVLVLRLAVAGAVVALLPATARHATLAATLGLVVTTAAYEAARSSTRRESLGGSGPVGGRLTRADLAVFVLIGGGYAVRLGLGAGLAGGTAGIVALTVAFGWAFGMMTVLLAWLIEAAFLRTTAGDGAFARKSHLAALARLVGDRPDDLEHPVLAPGAARLGAALLVLASAAAVALGVALGGSPGAARLAALVAVAVMAGPVVWGAWRSPWAGLAVLALDVAAAAVLVPGDGRDEMIALLVLVAGSAAGFRPVSVSAVRSMTLADGAAPARTAP